MLPPSVAPEAAATTVVAIHQPHYFPWLGLTGKIACCDVFIFLDNVQFEKNGWQHRTQYSTQEGRKFLSLSVQNQGVVSEQKTIAEVRLADARIPRKHLKTLQQRYGRTPGWPRLADRLEAVLTQPAEKMIDLCLATTRLTLEIYGITPRVYFASELIVPGQKTTRVVNLVKQVGGTRYLSGVGAKAYLEPDQFAAAGLELHFQEFSHPVYHQSTQTAFQPAAFALEWYLEDPDLAVAQFRAHLARNPAQPPRSMAVPSQANVSEARPPRFPSQPPTRFP